MENFRVDGDFIAELRQSSPEMERMFADIVNEFGTPSGIRNLREQARQGDRIKGSARERADSL